MRAEYDFSKAVKNPFVSNTKTMVTIRLDKTNVDYFKTLATEIGTPYQTLINSFLSDCVAKKMKPRTQWEAQRT